MPGRASVTCEATEGGLGADATLEIRGGGAEESCGGGGIRSSCIGESARESAREGTDGLRESEGDVVPEPWRAILRRRGV